MKIVIDIPESEYEIIMKHWGGYQGGCYSIYDSIKEGTPLPKGHGELIDRNEMMKRAKEWDTDDVIEHSLYNFAMNRILESPTVIKADRE